MSKKSNLAKIRYLNQVPNNAVGVAHIYNSPISAENTLQINDLSGLIFENQEHPSIDYIGYVDEHHQLHQTNYPASAEKLVTLHESEIGNTIGRIESQVFRITNIWDKEQPLFFSHILRHTVYEPNPSSTDYTDKITIVDSKSKPIRKIHKWKAKLVPTVNTGYHNVVLYTSFQSSNNTNFFAVYTAATHGQPSIPKRLELLNPQASFSRTTSLEECVSSKLDLYYQADYGMINSKVFLSIKAIRDTRVATEFRWRLHGETIGGATISGPIITDYIYANNIVMPHDKKYTNGRKELTENNAQQIMSAITTETIIRYRAESLTNKITCHTKSDGSGKIYGYNHNTGTTLNDPPEKYIVIEKEEIISGNTRKYTILAPILSLQLLDRRPIRVLPPIYSDSLSGWHLRVQSGWFKKSIIGQNGTTKEVIFKVSEFDTQHFDLEFGRPIKKALDETPIIMDSTHIQLHNKNIHITTDTEGIPNNILVTINDQVAEITGWNTIDATIQVSQQLQAFENIKVNYNYHETAYTYRGHISEHSPNTAQRLQYLDLNPTAVYSCTHQGLNPSSPTFSTLMPSTHLINKTIYLYITPTLEITDVVPFVIPLTGNSRSLVHSFEPIVKNDHLLLATIRVRPNSIAKNTDVIDVRVRGGGIIDATKANSSVLESYFDIGKWDGEPFPENAVIIVKIPRNILTEYGGRFTVDDVQRIVEKHAACGVLCLPEFI